VARWWARGCLWWCVVGCSYVPAPVRSSAPDLPTQVARAERILRASNTEAVVLVVLDGARWQDVLVGVDAQLGAGLDRGEIVAASELMPNLHAMIAHGAVVGARGADGAKGAIEASGPDFISLPGYNEILSGRTPVACVDNDCPATLESTIADEATPAAVFASWAPIARAATRGDRGVVVQAGDPRTGRFRADSATAALGLAYLAEHRPRFFFLGLGEPDELAHQGDYRGYLATLRQADGILGELELVLATLGERGRSTAVFVTCDHGRARDFRHHGASWPESSRVWLVATGGSIPARGAVAASEPHRLRDIAPTVRALLGLPADRSPLAGSPIAELLPSPHRPAPRAAP
jgi:hypothetical protein